VKKFKLKYWYLATGMEGVPQEYPEKVIEAESMDRAFYEYHKSNGIDFGSFDDFMNKEKYIREWATSCEEEKDICDCLAFHMSDECYKLGCKKYRTQN